MGKNKTYHERGKLVDGYKVQEHPLYTTWSGMLSRCFNSENPGYQNYGGRGVTVCDRWRHFENFAKDMGLKSSPELTLERMDVNGNYEPSNCCWETRSNQCVNRRIFKNNSSGATGVEKTNYSWKASFHYNNVDYNLGRFMSKSEAVEFRAKFVETFFLEGESAAIALLPEETVWNSSSTGHRGITKSKCDSVICRCTVDGERILIGSFKDVQSAVVARRRFLDLCESVGLDEAKKSIVPKQNRLRSTNSTGVSGVTFKESDQKFHLRLTFDGKRQFFGRFDTIEEASDARRRIIEERT